jgi:excisionase family DNA binding protein
MAPQPLGEPLEVADILKVPLTTLYQWRYKGIGPPSIRVGRHIRYRWADVEAWLEERQGSLVSRTRRGPGPTGPATRSTALASTIKPKGT